MKKKYAILFVALALLCALALLSACQKEPGNPSESNTDVPGNGAGTSVATETDSREEGSDTVPEETVPETVPETEIETETETEIETETETEPETEYDITQPEVMCEMNQSYYNVKDYGAVGDGLTDDTNSIKKCLLDAYYHSGVAYFPAGQYLVYETITLPKDDSKVMKVIGDKGAVLIGDDTMEGPILKVNMKYNFSMYNMEMEHRGQGSCIDALYLWARWCRFRADSENASGTVVFHGSNCRVIECSFDVENPQVYCLSYIKTRDEISINDHIVDNVFRGAAMGILVGDGDYPEDGRCEGLKINGNYFYNTGAEQIRVAEILHVNIAHNVLRNGEGIGIALTQAGHGADGVYINDNDIVMADSGLACIATVEGGDNYISSVNINNNRLVGGQYGVYDQVVITRAFIRENRISGQSVAGYFIGRTGVRNMYGLFDNVIDEPEGILSIQITSRTRLISMARNVVGPTNEYLTQQEEMFLAGCTTEKGENLTRLDPSKQAEE